MHDTVPATSRMSNPTSAARVGMHPIHPMLVPFPIACFTGALLTNQIAEGEQSGDFGKLYPGYSWTAEIQEVQTNKLFQVNYVVQQDSDKSVVNKMSVLLFRPFSPAGSLDGATVAR